MGSPRHWKPRFGSVALNPSHILSKVLVGYWLFNEGGGTKVLDLRGRRDGAITGSIWQAGPDGACLDFNGSTNFVDLGATAFLSGSLPFTLSIRHRADSVAGIWGTLFADYSASNNWRCTYSHPSYEAAYGNFTFGAASGFVTAKASFGNLTGVWRRITITYNGLGSTTLGNWAMYIDGVSIALAASDGYGAGAGNAMFGKGGNLSDHIFDGQISDCLICRRALTLAEISELSRDPYCFLTSPSPAKRFWAVVAAGTVYENTISFGGIGNLVKSKTSIMAKALIIPSGAGHVPSKSGVMGNTLSMAAQTLVNNNVIIAMQLSILSEVIAGLALTKTLTIDSGLGLASGAGVSEGSNAGFGSETELPASISHSPITILAMEKLLSLDSSASFAVINNLTMQAVLSILTLASQTESKSAVIEKVLPLLSNILQGHVLDLTVNKSLVFPVSSGQDLLSILDFSKELIMECSSEQLLAGTRIISKAVAIASISNKTIGANLTIDKSLLFPSLTGDLNSVVSLISKDVLFSSSSVISILSSLIYSKNLGLESLTDQQISNSMLSSLSAIFGSQTSELGTCAIEIAKGISLQVQSVVSFDRTSVLALSFSLGSDCGLSPSVISALQGAFILPASVSQSPSVVAELSSGCSFNSSAGFIASLGNLFQMTMDLSSVAELFPGSSAVYGAGVSVQASTSLSPTGFLLLDKDAIFSSIVDMLNSYGGTSYSSDIGYEGLAGLESSRILVFDKSFDLNSISALLLNSTIIFDSNLGLDLFVLQTPIGVMVLNKNVSLDSLIGLDLVLEKLVSSGVSFSAFNSLSLDKQLSILRTAEFISSSQLNRSSQGEFNPSILESSISGMSAAGTGTINLQLLFSSILSMNVSSAIAILRVLEAVITILTQSKYAMFAASKPMIFESTARTLSFVSSPRRG